MLGNLKHIAIISALTLLQACSTEHQKPAPQNIQTLAKQAYLYGFPMVVNYKTMYEFTLDKNHPEYKADFNTISCDARLASPEDKTVVTPNSDTPYCLFWMDLRAEPVVLSVPDMGQRFYHFQLVDLYTYNFAYVGTLSTGNQAGNYLLAGPNWQGEKPEGITKVLRSETNFIFSVTRTQLFGPDDLANVKAIQDQYALHTLSEYLGNKAPDQPASPAFPAWEEGAQFDARFFTYLDTMMDILGKPGAGEATLWNQLAELNIGPGHTFSLENLPKEQAEALLAGVKEGIADMEAFLDKTNNDPLGAGKWFGTRAYLRSSAQQNYPEFDPNIIRAVAAHVGLYGNDMAEAIYPTYFTDGDGEPLNASQYSYTVTFKKDQLPPVKAFWSLTMYDGETKLLVENNLDRYLLNSTMLEQFQWQEDGSLTLYIGKEAPESGFKNNWLPAPDGPFYMVLRLYGPEEAALKGGWVKPEAYKQ